MTPSQFNSLTPEGLKQVEKLNEFIGTRKQSIDNYAVYARFEKERVEIDVESRFLAQGFTFTEADPHNNTEYRKLTLTAAGSGHKVDLHWTRQDGVKQDNRWQGGGGAGGPPPPRPQAPPPPNAPKGGRQGPRQGPNLDDDEAEGAGAYAVGWGPGGRIQQGAGGGAGRQGHKYSGADIAEYFDKAFFEPVKEFMSEVQDKCNRRGDTVKDLKAKNKGKTDRINELTQLNTARTAEKKRLADENATKAAEIARLTATNGDQAAEIAQLTATNAAQAAEIARLTEINGVERTRAEIARLTPGANAAQAAEIGQLRTQLGRASDKQSGFNRRMQAVRDTVAVHVARILQGLRQAMAEAAEAEQGGANEANPSAGAGSKRQRSPSADGEGGSADPAIKDELD
jgi:hypothetical protein